jgi:hypothetical protein
MREGCRGVHTTFNSVTKWETAVQTQKSMEMMFYMAGKTS